MALKSSRSLWDHYALIADFDIEYVNFDDPAEAFVDPERVFAIQQPVVETIEQLLRVTYRRAARAQRPRPPFCLANYAEFGRVQRTDGDRAWSPEFVGMRNRSSSAEPSCRPDELARAFAGLGLAMEFLGHRVKQVAAPQYGNSG